MSSISSTDVYHKLIQASHILAHHSVLDGFGHISMRNPTNSSTFIQSSMPAALLSDPSNFLEYSITDGKPVNEARVSPYSEHYIHAAILNRFPEINSVVHSHAKAVLPFGVGKQPLRPLIHTAGFLGESVPVWDIESGYSKDHKRDLLVNDYRLAESLAALASNESNAGFHSVVLQRGHGFVALGTSVEQAVYNAIYTVENAVVLREALQVHGGVDLTFLSADEIRDCAAMNASSTVKVWPLWSRECEKDFSSNS